MKRTEPGDAPPIETASTEEALEFVREIAKRRGDRSPADEARVRQYVNSIPLGRLQGIARRIMMDVVRGPTGGEAPRPRRRAAATKTPRSGRRGKPGRGGS